MERQLCDRKLDQLTSKRRDEEDRRAILSKRVARAKVRFNCYTLKLHLHIIVCIDPGMGTTCDGTGERSG